MTPDLDGELIDGRYALERVIGRGAMAEVRAGADRRLGRPVAVKLLHENLAAQPEARVRFEEEARAAARLTDPNVVAIYDTGEHRGRPFIVMELLPGRTFHDELRDGPMSEARARAVIADVLRALRAAHEAGVVHRDIKPANILLTATGDAKVADFGIAKVAASSDLTATGLVLGTPSYLAPECITGGAATAASDLYAVGVVLYEALSGCRPFAAETPLALCRAILSDAPRPLGDLCPRVSAEAVTVVNRAMAKDPEDRYRSADDMIRALDGDAAPVFASVDEPTQPMDAEPTRDARALPTVALASIATEERASATGIARCRPRDRTRARVVAGLAAAAAALGIGLLLGIGNHGVGTATKPSVTTAATTPPTTASTATAPPATVATTPSTKPGKGHGPGHAKPPKPGHP